MWSGTTIESRCASAQQRSHARTHHTRHILILRTLHTHVYDQLHLWDPSGRERFRSISPIVFRNAHGAVVVYDIADRSTFDGVTLWMEEIRKYPLHPLLFGPTPRRTSIYCSF
jgi:GTPase SAR1 family protein